MNFKLILFVALISFSFVNPAISQEAKTLKVMSYNIWNGFDWGKDLARKSRCLEFIRSQNPDVVAYQELCAYTDEMLEADAKTIGHAYSILLKTSGYSVGISSNQPIVLKERALDGFWHGMLHCEIYGIDFFVVHFSPFDFAFRLNEAEMVSERVNKLSKNTGFIVLGDFNAFSPFDAEYLESNPNIKAKMRAEKPKDNYSNLRDSEFDYSVLSKFLGLPVIDVVRFKVAAEKRFTFPTPALINYGGVERKWEEFILQRERIDYILASPNLARKCVSAEIFNDESTAKLSDHYPIMAVFGLGKWNADDAD